MSQRFLCVNAALTAIYCIEDPMMTMDKRPRRIVFCPEWKIENGTNEQASDQGGQAEVIETDSGIFVVTL